MGNVLLVKKGKDVLVFYNETEMKSAGYSKADKLVTEEVFNSNGCYVRIIDGDIVVGRTDKEKQIQSTMDSIAEIDEQLNCLDNKYLTLRTLSGLAQNDAFAIEAASKHNDEAIPLRTQRATYQAKLIVLMK